MKHIPNILSGLRILLIPFIVWQLMAGNGTAATLLLILSGLTDLLDGYLARTFGWESQVGKVLDPIADKLTQGAVFVMMALAMPRFWWLFVILLLKELVMLALGGYLLTKGVKLESAKWFGKVATTIFYVVMSAIILFPSMPGWLLATLLALVVASSLFAAGSYLPVFFQYQRSRREAADECSRAETPLVMP